MRTVYRRLRLFLGPVRLAFLGACSMNSSEIVHGPNLRQAALITVVGYLLGFGVPFVSFYVLPKIFVVNSAAQTSQNILANQGLFVAAIFAMLLNFIGDVLAAWGLYVLLRPVNSSISMLAAWFRVVYATIGIAALLNLVTAYGLLTRPDYLMVFGRGQLDAQVQLAVDSFNFQFAFGLTVFGVYVVILGLLVIKSGYIPTWLGVVLVIDGAGVDHHGSGPLSSPTGQSGVPHRHVIRGTAPPGLAYRLGHKAERTESGCHGPTGIVRHGMTENDHLLGRVPMEE